MINMANFYDNMDLKYPEIGIAMQVIDRFNPGKVKMCIPILTPNMDNSHIIEKNERQNTNNLMNLNKGQLDVGNISITNYVYVPFPESLCNQPKASCLECVCRDIHECTCKHCHDEDNRYIPEGSKWIIVFIGGDITKPRAIAKYVE